jgi:hypothetical protein
VWCTPAPDTDTLPGTKVKSPVLLPLLLLLSPLSALSAQLSPFLQEHRLGVIVTHVPLAPTLRKDLASGLTNKILIRVVLAQDGKPLIQRLVGIAVRYDLWEETFSMDTRVDDVMVDSKTYRQLDDVVLALGNLRLPDLFGPGQTAQRAELVLTAELLFNPVEKERMDEIRKWVAENSGAALPDPSTVRPGLSAPAPGSDSRALFNKIFQQYAAGASIAAAWKDSGSSKPFKVEELRDEPAR